VDVSSKDSVYLDRWRIVRGLGFQNYNDYLQSELWSRIRSRVIRKSRGMCSMCEGRANQVHHTRYTKENLSGANINHMIASCEDCHHLIHLNNNEFVGQVESMNRADIFIKSKKVVLKHKTHKKDFRVDAKCVYCGLMVKIFKVKDIARNKCKCGGRLERFW
jgi:hypothetical protein